MLGEEASQCCGIRELSSAICDLEPEVDVPQTTVPVRKLSLS